MSSNDGPDAIDRRRLRIGPESGREWQERQRARQWLLRGELAVEVRGGHAAVDEEVAAANEGAVGAHEKRGHCGDLVGGACATGALLEEVEEARSRR